jgi:aldehyde dehydrogenase (NAD+)
MEMIARAAGDGAELVAGGSRASIPGFEDGFFLQPTILRPRSSTDFIMQEEVFGPVLSIFPFDDEEEAIAIANGTRFGLAAGVWTRDFARAHRMARALHTGTVWINTYRALAPASPFGGVRASGTGRQNGQEAVYQYLTTKSVWCELGDDIQDPFVIRT